MVGDDNQPLLKDTIRDHLPGLALDGIKPARQDMVIKFNHVMLVIGAQLYEERLW